VSARKEIRKLIERYTANLESINSWSIYQQEEISDKKMDGILNYLAPGIEKESVVFLVDFSLLGNAKIGMVFTEGAVFWRTGSGEEERSWLPYDRIKHARQDERGLVLNEMFIHFRGLWRHIPEVVGLFLKIKLALPGIRRKAIAESRRARELRQQRRAEQRSRSRIVGNIGNYVAGEEINIRDSVVIRSGNNAPSAEELVMADRTAVLGNYETLLSQTLKDGQISYEELRFLSSVRVNRNISPKEHDRILRGLLKKGEHRAADAGKEEYSCPGCAGTLEYVEDHGAWFCWACDSYPFLEEFGVEGEDVSWLQAFIKHRVAVLPSLEVLSHYPGDKIPERKYEKLCEHIARLDRKEILYFNDTTFWGSGKEGLVLTGDHLYWNIYCADPEKGSLELRDIVSVEMHGEAINFNGGSYSIPCVGLLKETWVAVFEMMRDISTALRMGQGWEERTMGNEMEGPALQPVLFEEASEMDRFTAGVALQEQEVVHEQSADTSCPDCGEQLEYITDYGSWYCWNCDAYPFRE